MNKIRVLRNYGVIPNSIINNPKLSLKAKGLWVFLQSKPNGWQFSIQRITRQTKDGKQSIGTALKELEKAGLLQRKPAKDDNGKWSGYEYVLSEKPSPENPSTGKPSTENPYTLSNKDNSKKEYSNKEKDIKDSNEKKNSRNQTPKQAQRTKKAVRKEDSEKKAITQNKNPSKEITTNEIHEKAKELIKEFAEMRNIPLDEGFFKKEIRAAHALVRQYPIEVILAGISWRLGNDDEGFWEKKLWSLNTVYSHFAEWIAEAKHRKKQKNKTFETWLDKHPEYDFRNETDQYVKATRYLQAFKEAKKAGVIFTTTEIHKRLVAAAVIRDETKTYQR